MRKKTLKKSRSKSIIINRDLITRGAEIPHGVKSDYFYVSVLGIAVLKRVLNSLCVYVVPNPI